MDSQDSELDCDPAFMNDRERKFSLYSTDTEERVSIKISNYNLFMLKKSSL